MSTNNTKAIIDSLRKQYQFRLNLGNRRMEFHKVKEKKYRDLTDQDFNSIKVELGLKGITC